MTDPVYALTWPRGLFEWEARRILALPVADSEWASKATHLLREAYHDEEVALAFRAQYPSSYSIWDVRSDDDPDKAGRDWLTALLKDDLRLQPYRAPIYYAERNGAVDALAPGQNEATFAQDFFELIDTMRETGYFPKVLPKDCVDEYLDRDEVRKTIRRATKLEVSWPLTGPDIRNLPDAALYSLVEYFHDHAQRPRRSWYHDFSDCGLHYEDCNSTSGHSVYRWRVNSLLTSHKVPLRLGTSGEEQGRLIRVFNTPLDDLATQQIAQRVGDPEDEVAHAVRKFRARDATVIDKRAAIALLYGELEPKRNAMKKKVSSSDESDLFRIANQFTIRHRDKAQRSDFGEEFLDWTFWTYLATANLMDEIAARNVAANADYGAKVTEEAV
jgi:hypothetical protein